MKLYFVPNACSLSPHIALRELGLSHELERVDLATKKTVSGRDFLAVNPKGYVPALEFDNGQVLTEGVAILLYLAQQAPNSVPDAGSWEYIRLVEALNFISTEIHKGIGTLFSMEDGPAKEKAKEKIQPRLAYLAQQLQGKDYFLGDFTLADAYLFTTLRWTAFLGISLADYPVLTQYLERVAARPQVAEALQVESPVAVS